MKIAHLTTVDLSLRYLILPQLEAAAGAGEAVAISAPGPHVPFVESRGVRHVPLPSSTRGMDPLSDLKAMTELWKVLRDEKLDVLHTHNPKPGVYGRILGRLAGVPIVVNTIHGLYATEESRPASRAVVYALEWLASRFSDAELVQSPEDLALLRRLRLTPRRRTRLLGNGVDLERFSPGRARQWREFARAEMTAGEEDVVVGMVGRLVAEKGIPELVEAAETLRRPYKFVVVGPHDPEKPDALPEEILARGRDAGVVFMGMREDMDRLYGGFDLFVLPSHREGFPRAAMEAAASGLPVVATDIRGCRQVVDDGRTGYLFPRADVRRLVERVRELGEDDELRARMGEASRDKAERDFDEDRVVDIVMGTYEELAARKGLSWAAGRPGADPTIREAARADARAVARLHQRMIGTGFLSSLGPSFLELLYDAMVSHDGSVVLVAEAVGVVYGFVSGTESTGGFYRHFIRSHGLKAAAAVAPRMLRPAVLRRAWETLRYGTEDDGAKPELLAMAVAPASRGRGLGKRLVADLLDWAARRGLREMRVVVGEANRPAKRLYEGSGFQSPRRIEVHSGEESWELTWSR